jgi:hypothetical protein
MFGFPTGIGALVLAPGIGAWLREKRPWFAGGTVDVVQVPGTAVGRTTAIDEAFEVSVSNCGINVGWVPEPKYLGWDAQLHPSPGGDDRPPSPRCVSARVTRTDRSALCFLRTPLGGHSLATKWSSCGTYTLTHSRCPTRARRGGTRRRGRNLVPYV